MVFLCPEHAQQVEAELKQLNLVDLDDHWKTELILQVLGDSTWKS
jgi:hypothetical protein